MCVPKQFYHFHNMNSGAFYYKPRCSAGKRQHPRPSREKWIALEQNQFTFVVSSSCWKILHHGDPEGLRPPKTPTKKQEHLLGKFDNRFFYILSRLEPKLKKKLFWVIFPTRFLHLHFCGRHDFVCFCGAKFKVGFYSITYSV